MSALLTPAQMAKAVMEALENAVSDLPEDERDEAKARILVAWKPTKFYGKTREKNT